MKVTLIRSDNAVYINGVSQKVDLSSLPEDVHAVQWDSERSYGEVEMIDVETGRPWGNRPIRNFSEYEHFLPLWEEAKAKKEAEIEARKKQNVQEES